VVIFPHCKINLGLYVTGKRADGYHNIETVFYPIPFRDCLEVIHDANARDGIEFSSSGIPVPMDPDQNLSTRAYLLLKKDFPSLPAVRMHLHKCIPTGAGLGGGSADGAFALTLLNSKFHLGLDVSALSRYALTLGSDAPFFLQTEPCIGTGRGEELQEVKINLAGFRMLLVNPGIAVSTAWAFSTIQPRQPLHAIREIISSPVESWKSGLANDFEKPVFEKYPAVAAIKKRLYEAGAVYASMSGSGSTVYGIFKTEIPKIEFDPHYLVKQLKNFTPGRKD